MKIAIIDVLGLPFDGSTLEKQGLGGSESAIISISRELTKIGFEVTVFNDCNSNFCKKGFYDGVYYLTLDSINNCDEDFDILIGSRSVAPFLTDNYKNKSIEYLNFEKIFDRSKKKILWMHDTFCEGDEYIEHLVNSGRIDEIFTLSDFHTNYITNCEHGQKRNFEVLKKHIFQTRNGINKHLDWVDIKEKDKNHYVYNASVSKGMVPLLEDIWPKIKERIPDAKLTVIGGYYNFKEDSAPDEQENKWVELKDRFGHEVNFTGVIPQQNIADILANASYMIYPAVFPETFGISSLESLYYNTPIITCEFGALEETAIDSACYKIPYAIEPNSLFPNINTEYQKQAFANLVVDIYNNPYFHQQKMYACNQVNEICGWDSVALQWKQHLYKITGRYLSKKEYRKVSHINNEVKRIFGRRFSNPEEVSVVKNEQQKIVIISPAYNADKYLERCIQSVQSQDYDNYEHIIIDDASTDSTQKLLENFNLHAHGIRYILNSKRNGSAVQNQVEAIKKYTDYNDIIILLDGDDWLANDPNIFHKYNNLYHSGAEFTYGSCWSEADNITLIAQPYPPEVLKNKTYREYKFNWNIPYTHLRTFKSGLIHHCDLKSLKDNNGNWLKAGGDVELFYNLIENSDSDKIVCIPDIVCHYNDKNPINDYKVNSKEQTKNAQNSTTKRILIATPTNNNIENETYKSIFNLKVPDNYKTSFECFYGYSQAQVINLMIDYTLKNNFDYLLYIKPDYILDENRLLYDLAPRSITKEGKVITSMLLDKKSLQSIKYPHFENSNFNLFLEKLEDYTIIP